MTVCVCLVSDIRHPDPAHRRNRARLQRSIRRPDDLAEGRGGEVTRLLALPDISLGFQQLRPYNDWHRLLCHVVCFDGECTERLCHRRSTLACIILDDGDEAAVIAVPIPTECSAGQRRGGHRQSLGPEIENKGKRTERMERTILCRRNILERTEWNGTNGAVWYRKMDSLCPIPFFWIYIYIYIRWKLWHSWATMIFVLRACMCVFF